MQYRTRSAYLQRAHEAYRQGRFSVAKRFSLLGQGHNSEMAKYHRMAAEQIFSARNQAGRDAIIDLHGLHVDEAIYFLDARLWELETENTKHCFVFTGSGRHSTGRAKLLPAILAYLEEEEGFHVADCSPDRRGGMLIVEW
jgi:DNA-nicking Smr family endonuclease